MVHSKSTRLVTSFVTGKWLVTRLHTFVHRPPEGRNPFARRKSCTFCVATKPGWISKLVSEMNSYLEDRLPPLASLRTRRIWAWYPPVVTNQQGDEFVEYTWLEVYQQLLVKSNCDPIWTDEQAD